MSYIQDWAMITKMWEVGGGGQFVCMCVGGGPMDVHLHNKACWEYLRLLLDSLLGPSVILVTSFF